MKINHLCILNNSRLETLGILNIDRLNVAVQFLFCIFFVISLSRDSDAESEWTTLDTSLPDLLVQLGIETNIGCALYHTSVRSYIPAFAARFREVISYH